MESNEKEVKQAHNKINKCIELMGEIDNIVENMTVVEFSTYILIVEMKHTMLLKLKQAKMEESTNEKS